MGILRKGQYQQGSSEIWKNTTYNRANKSYVKSWKTSVTIII